MTYEQASKLPRSEKITLITCEAVQLAKIFQPYDTNIYVRDVPYFVVDVKINGGSGGQADSIEDLNPTQQWFYDIQEKKLYVTLPNDPKAENISIVYRFFFSNSPVILPYDLSSGHDVEWLPLVQQIGSIGQQLDDENTGIVLESQSQIDFINNHGFFDDKFDTLIWENQNVNFYSWFREIPISEAKRIFTGVIESKDFQVNKVTFRVKDFVFRLKNKLKLDLFSENDGILLDSIIGTPKRRIYGQVRQVKTVPLDCTLDGYPLTGTINLTLDSKIVTGTGTSFLQELNQDDEIIFFYQDEEVIYSVDTIQSNTSLTLTKEAEQTVINQSVIVSSEHPYRFKNRRWHIAGHKIRESIATITDVINARTYVVDDVSEFFADDFVTINNQTTQITRISGNQIILEQNLGSIPSIGNFITRFPINRVLYNQKELIPTRDYTLTNNDEAVLEIDPLAEFNIGREIVTDHNLQFNDGVSPASYTVTSNASADLRTIIKPGDFIRAENQQNDNWYEVGHVGPQIVYIKTPFSNNGNNANSKARIKKTDGINDNSTILVDCYGLDYADSWVRNASDVVKHLIVNDAEFSSINEDTFEQAKSDCNYTISMVIPETVGSESPMIRDVISKVNESVFGSLYGNSSQELCYSIVNTRRPADILPIKDDDIISWSVQSNQKILNQVKVNYAPFVDSVSYEDGFKTITFNSEFVNNNIGIKNTTEKTIYLFNDSDALVIAQRLAFYNSLSQSILTLKAKANFFTASVNDRCYIQLDRLYARFGGTSNRKIGVISGIKKSAYDSEVIMNDLGNIFNRCPIIAPNNTPDFTASDEDEKIKFGYILDNDTETPDPSSEYGLGSYLIG